MPGLAWPAGGRRGRTPGKLGGVRRLSETGMRPPPSTSFFSAPDAPSCWPCGLGGFGISALSGSRAPSSSVNWTLSALPMLPNGTMTALNLAAARTKSVFSGHFRAYLSPGPWHASRAPPGKSSTGSPRESIEMKLRGLTGTAPHLSKPPSPMPKFSARPADAASPASASPWPPPLPLPLPLPWPLPLPLPGLLSGFATFSPLLAPLATRWFTLRALPASSVPSSSIELVAPVAHLYVM
mmetsp:Transcript_290/g.978  ORF Transcript_290/g.978 Transcript_290/m.978 type:complete len:239 (+) Transcript_290:301-1017(+)